MHSTRKERKNVVAERFTRTLKNLNLQIYDSNFKNMYIDK